MNSEEIKSNSYIPSTAKHQPTPVFTSDDKL